MCQSVVWSAWHEYPIIVLSSDQKQEHSSSVLKDSWDKQSSGIGFGEIHLKKLHPEVITITSYPSMGYHFQAFWLLSLFSLEQNLSTGLDLDDEKRWAGEELFILEVSQARRAQPKLCVTSTFSELWSLCTGFRVCLFIASLQKKKKNDLEEDADSSAWNDVCSDTDCIVAQESSPKLCYRNISLIRGKKRIFLKSVYFRMWQSLFSIAVHEFSGMFPLNPYYYWLSGGLRLRGKKCFCISFSATFMRLKYIPK